MSRIDANLAIAMGDSIRPQAFSEDHLVQQQAARARAVSRPAPESLVTVDDAPGSDDLRAAAEQVRQVIEVASGRQLSFDLDDSGKTLLFKITGSQGEMIKQIPGRDVLELRQRIDDLVGALVDQKA
jgi:uncharacterized FlaG/YvyC family protein